jgi:hypothetical protein
LRVKNLYLLNTHRQQGADKMEYTTITDNTQKINSVKSKIEKFETTLKNSLNIIEKHKQVSSEETQLIKLSFETMLSFLTQKSEEL